MSGRNNPMTRENYERAHAHVQRVLALTPPVLDNSDDRQLGELAAAMWGLMVQVQFAQNERAANAGAAAPTDTASSTTSADVEQGGGQES